MSPFIKTLFGDFHNVAVVAAILGITAALELAGAARAAWLIMPMLTLCGVAWLVRK